LSSKRCPFARGDSFPPDTPTTITVKGKDKTFTVDAKTEFWRPKGGDRGTGPKGLADECMAKGYEIKVLPAKDPTVAKDVYLPNKKPK
jgi:hypothetical protein